MRNVWTFALFLMACACATENNATESAEVRVDAGKPRDAGARDGATEAALGSDIPPHEGMRISERTGDAPAVASASATRLVVAWRSDKRIFYRLSENAGVSWGTENVVTFPAEVSPPSLSVDPAGRIHMAVASGGALSTLQLAAGTTTFTEPTLVASVGGATHVRIFATSSATQLLTYDVAGSVATYRIAAGAAATTGTIASNNAEDVSVCEGTGRLYAIYRESDGAAAHATVRTSDDDGRSWSANAVHAEKPGAMLVSKVACVAHGDDIWAMWATPGAGNALSNIEVAHSTNRGQSFRPETLRVFDAASATIARAPAFVREDDGTLGLAYIGGASENDANGSVRYARKGVRTFNPSEVVDVPVALASAVDAQALALSTRSTSLFVAYAAPLSGGSSIYFRAFPLSHSAH